MFLEISQNSQENTCARPEKETLLQAQETQKETHVTGLKKRLAQVFSCEFCEIFKNTFFTEHVWTTASELINAFYWVNLNLT